MGVLLWVVWPPFSCLSQSSAKGAMLPFPCSIASKQESAASIITCRGVRSFAGTSASKPGRGVTRFCMRSGRMLRARLDLGDLATDHLQTHRDDQRLVPFLHHAIESDLARGRIHRMHLEGRRGFRCAHPQTLAHLDLRRVL